MRQGRKRKQRITLARANERLAQNLPDKVMVAPVEIDDPYEYGAKIVAFKSLRDDPLGRYHVRRMIDDAQYQGGRAWQDDYEAAEIGGASAIDTTKEPVDGRRYQDMVTDRQRDAMGRLARDARQLGMEGEAILRDVLGDRLFMEQVAQKRGFSGQRAIDYFSARFRECLETLAIVRGFAMRSGKHTRG